MDTQTQTRTWHSQEHKAQGQGGEHLSPESCLQPAGEAATCRDLVARNWGDYPLMLTPRHIVDITGWSRTFTYEQLRPYGQLSHLVQRYGRRFMVSRDALRRLFDGEEGS